MRKLIRLSKKDHTHREQTNEYLRQQHEAEQRRRQELENELLRRDQEAYLKRLEEDRLQEAQSKLERDELWKQQQLEFLRQEAEVRRQERLRNTTPEALRRLRELIRLRYELDVEIWNNRDVQKADQEIVINRGMKADAILQEVYDIVDTWEEDGTWTADEWKVAKKIKESLDNRDCQIRIWGDNPPWKDHDA